MNIVNGDCSLAAHRLNKSNGIGEKLNASGRVFI